MILPRIRKECAREFKTLADYVISRNQQIVKFLCPLNCGESKVKLNEFVLSFA